MPTVVQINRFSGTAGVGQTARFAGTPVYAGDDRVPYGLALSGDMNAGGEDLLLLSGDMTDGDDYLLLSGDARGGVTVNRTDRF